VGVLEHTQICAFYDPWVDLLFCGRGWIRVGYFCAQT
jgi:hypothetical protein